MLRRGALPQRRVPVTYAGKATTPPPATNRSKRALIGSSSTTNTTSDAETIEHLQEEVNTWRTATETCTKEKDFYYSKLRAIELLCNTPGVSGHPVAKAVEDILYAATQEEGEAHLAAAIAELEMRDDAEQEQDHAEQLAAEQSAGSSHHTSRRTSRASEHPQLQYPAEAAAAY